MPPLGSIASRNEGEGAFDHEGAEFLLKSLVAFDVGKPDACSNVGAVSKKIYKSKSVR